jgi:hypothetical protein
VIEVIIIFNNLNFSSSSSSSSSSSLTTTTTTTTTKYTLHSSASRGVEGRRHDFAVKRQRAPTKIVK